MDPGHFLIQFRAGVPEFLDVASTAHEKARNAGARDEELRCVLRSADTLFQVTVQTKPQFVQQGGPKCVSEAEGG